LFSFFSKNAFCQKEILRSEIERISQSAQGKVGVAIAGLEDGDSLSLSGDTHFPMQSVYKFPLAMAVLQAVDSGKLLLGQKIHLQKKDLLEDTWSPMRDKYPNGNMDLTLQEVLSYCISYSDNNACDILFRLIGGPRKVQKFVRSIGIRNIAIVATEEEMHKSWKTQFRNWCTPLAMTEILKVFYEKKSLSASSSDLLLSMMTESKNSPKRIKGLLPEGTVAAHKTGTSGTNDDGMSAATNDVGIVTLPNGNHVAIVVYVSMSNADDNTRESVIAQIAKAAWDYYVIKK
jgi:beta-lactamase class A